MDSWQHLCQGQHRCSRAGASLQRTYVYSASKPCDTLGSAVHVSADGRGASPAVGCRRHRRSRVFSAPPVVDRDRSLAAGQCSKDAAVGYDARLRDLSDRGIGAVENRPDTVVVGNDSVLRSTVLGNDWPNKGKLDLGGRVLDVLPTPGLDESAISVFDGWSGILFTGNTLYPGRLVIRDYPRYLESLEALTDLSREKHLRFILGGRIEMSAEPGLDYMLRSNYRPNERSLQLTVSDLQDARNIVRLIDGREDIHIHDDFIVMHGVGRGARAYGWPVYIPEQFRKNRTR